jgi:plasmid segregation protein ParM
MVPTYAFGFDFGNAETGATLFAPDDGSVRSLTLPSATAPGRLADLLRTRAGLGLSHLSLAPNAPAEEGRLTALSLSSQEYVLECEGNEWFVGELALTQAREASTARGDISRYWSRRALHLLLVASAALLAPALTEYELAVVTGLPVETFNAQTRKKVRTALEGTHSFTFNGRSRLAHVQVVSVIMEGAGALIAHGSTLPITQGCIDVGGRTTDLFVASGQQPILPLCQGKPLGVESVADLLSQRFEDRYGRPLKAAELRAILHSYVQQQSPSTFAFAAGTLPPAEPTLYASGRAVPFEELAAWCQALFEEAGAEIAAFVGAAWNSSETGAVGADIGQVLLVGGGAYYVAGSLKARIPHLVVPPRPELANATGYGALAHQWLRSHRPAPLRRDACLN